MRQTSEVGGQRAEVGDAPDVAFRVAQASQNLARRGPLLDLGSSEVSAGCRPQTSDLRPSFPALRPQTSDLGSPTSPRRSLSFSVGGAAPRRSLSFSVGGAAPRRSLSFSVGGFTLIELMATITIIAILAGIVLGIAGYAQRRAANDRAKAEIKTIESALEAYKLDVGQYPTSSTTRGTSTLHALTNSWLMYSQLTSSSRTYLTTTKDQTATTSGMKHLVDPFDNPYNYFRVYTGSSDTATNQVTFDLWSYGPNGVSSTAADKADDLTNWQ